MRYAENMDPTMSAKVLPNPVVEWLANPNLSLVDLFRGVHRDHDQTAMWIDQNSACWSAIDGHIYAVQVRAQGHRGVVFEGRRAPEMFEPLSFSMDLRRWVMPQTFQGAGRRPCEHAVPAAVMRWLWAETRVRRAPVLARWASVLRGVLARGDSGPGTIAPA
jgi:hypothetical protein